MDSESAFISTVAPETDIDAISDDEIADLDDENHARSIGERIINDSRAEAARHKKIVEDECDAIFESMQLKCKELEETTREGAYKAGYDEGYADGGTVARNLEAKARGVLEDAERRRMETITRLEPEMVDVILQVIDKIVGSAAANNPKLIQVLVKKAMAEVSTIGGVKVRVSSADYEAAAAARDEYLALVEGGADVEVIRDLSLGGTDCIIETPYGSVDCSLDEQMDRVREYVRLILDGE
jgi:flagellar assembly protein FliH